MKLIRLIITPLIWKLRDHSIGATIIIKAAGIGF